MVESVAASTQPDSEKLLETSGKLLNNSESHSGYIESHYQKLNKTFDSSKEFYLYSEKNNNNEKIMKKYELKWQYIFYCYVQLMQEDILCI